MLCPYCKKELENDSLFCSYCGEKIEQRNGSFCTQCGAKLEENAFFCSKCGASQASKAEKNTVKRVGLTKRKKKALIIGGVILLVVIILFTVDYFIQKDIQEDDAYYEFVDSIVSSYGAKDSIGGDRILSENQEIVSVQYIDPLNGKKRDSIAIACDIQSTDYAISMEGNRHVVSTIIEEAIENSRDIIELEIKYENNFYITYESGLSQTELEDAINNPNSKFYKECVELHERIENVAWAHLLGRQDIFVFFNILADNREQYAELSPNGFSVISDTISDIVGTWALYGAIADGEELTLEDIQDTLLGQLTGLQFDLDGSMMYVTNGRSHNGTWRWLHTNVFEFTDADGNVGSILIDNSNHLNISIEGFYILLFEKSGNPSANKWMEETNTAAFDPAAYTGSWNLVDIIGEEELSDQDFSYLSIFEDGTFTHIIEIYNSELWLEGYQGYYGTWYAANGSISLDDGLSLADSYWAYCGGTILRENTLEIQYANRDGISYTMHYEKVSDDPNYLLAG